MKNKRISRWKTIIAIPVFGLASVLAGYYSRDVKNYADWRTRNVRVFQPAGEEGLLGFVMRETEALSAFRHRNEKLLDNVQVNHVQEPVQKYQKEKVNFNVYLL